MISISNTKATSCDGKVKHLSQRAATQAAITYERNENLAKHAMAAYKCKYCHYWHIGHTSLEVRLKKLRKYRGGTV